MLKSEKVWHQTTLRVKQLYPEFGSQTICDVFGKTRQAHYKQINHHNELDMQQTIIIKMVEAIRNDMPKSGGGKLFFMLKESMLEHEIDIGRDKFFDVLSMYGYLVHRKKDENQLLPIQIIHSTSTLI